MRKISSQALAIAADWDQTSHSKKAKKRRRKWEIQAFAERTGVVTGTLEMACDLPTDDLLWTSRLIVVDEAAQATEPMTLIPLQLADDDTHVVLIGDHMQLAPTVLSKAAAFAGLGASMFERLIRVGGVDSCMLTLQYRMHESICSWPSREFYVGKLLPDSSVGARDRGKGLPWPPGGSVRTGDIGVITPYDAQTSLIKSMLWEEYLGDVEAANIDGFQGRDH